MKGCRGAIEDIRLTEREWEVAEELGEKYVLCIVSHMDSPGGSRISFLTNPFAHLAAHARRQTRLQTVYVVGQAELRRLVESQA